MVYPDNAFQQTFYNNLGQVIKEVDPDGVTTLYQYNGKGEREYVALDMNQNGVIDFAGSDRITRTVTDAVYNHNTHVSRTQTFVWDTPNSDTAKVVSTTETSTDGLQSWQTIWNNGQAVTSYTATTYDRPNHRRTVAVTAPDGTVTTTVYQDGRQQSVTAYSVGGASQLGQNSFSYDAHGRLQYRTDARNGTTTNVYNLADQVISVISPAPGPGLKPQTNSVELDDLSRPVTITFPDQTALFNEYYLAGDLMETYGSQTYYAYYTYDAQGRVTGLTTYRDYAQQAGQDNVYWVYNAQRGWLDAKTYHSGPTATYTYTPAGRLKTRTGRRGLTTTQVYGFEDGVSGNEAGDLARVAYSDSTPMVTAQYDRRGRLQSVVCNNITSTLAYGDAWQLMSESYSGGILNGLSVTTGYDAYLRRTNLAVNTSSPINQSFGYDPQTGRLLTTSIGASSSTYSYLANSTLIGQITYAQSGTTRLTASRQYDILNRLCTNSAVPVAGMTNSFVYRYNDANQRTNLTLADGYYWDYHYDSLGQVISGKKYAPSSTDIVPGQAFEYAYDEMGNRLLTTTDIGSAEYAPYSYNQSENRYYSRQVPSDIAIIGMANAGASLTAAINGQSASVYRNGEYFVASGASGNDTGSVWVPVSVTVANANGTNQQPASAPGHLLVPPATQTFQYDADGNLTNDCVWRYTWDAKDRLIKMDCLVSGPVAQHLTFEYDWRGRRIRKWVQDANTNTIADLRYVYDGWNLVAILNSSFSIQHSFLWGLDLSGSFQGAGLPRQSGATAGGIGDLLAINDVTNGMHFVAYDGNGNVAALVKAVDGTISARYEYGPFGELIRASGPMAKVNPIRWSTKYWDEETDLVYYGYRYYSPSLGRWLSRDPMGEYSFELSRQVAAKNCNLLQPDAAQVAASANLYCFVGNNPINSTDPFGLFGNPVSGPNGPVGPSSPYAPGGLNYPDGYLFKTEPDCIQKCLDDDPLLSYAIALTPFGLVNIKNPIGELRTGASPFTTIDRRLGWPLGKGGAVVERIPGIVKYVGPIGTTSAALSALGIGYMVGAYLRCTVECAAAIK